MAAAALSFAAQPVTISGNALTKHIEKPGQTLSYHGAILSNPSLATPETRKAPAFASDGEELWINWGYCDEPYTGLDIYDEFSYAIQVIPEAATAFAGSSITAVQVCNPYTQQFTNPVKNATVWVAESLEGPHICEGTGALGKESLDYSQIELDQPYMLEAGKAVYVGVTMNVAKTTQVLSYIADGYYPEYPETSWLYSNIIGVSDDGTKLLTGPDMNWLDAGEIAGNVCMLIHLTGDTLPRDRAVIDEYAIPTTAEANENFTAMFVITNWGANQIDRAEFTCTFEGYDPQVATGMTFLYNNQTGQQVTMPIGYGESALVGVYFNAPAEGIFPYSIEMTRVGTELNNLEAKIDDYMVSLVDGYPKNTVIEEATGTWCGYCPAGYAGMEYMKENYAGKGFIGIAMHEGDPMSVLDQGECYYPVAKYLKGFPSSFMNRNWKENIYPEPEELEYYFEQDQMNPAMAQFGMTLDNYDSKAKTMTLHTTADFAFDMEDADFSIAYVVVEDEVGPYSQTNYYSGASGSYWGFESKGESVRLKFNDVAREGSQPVGIKNSVPASVVKGETYTFDTEVSFAKVKKLENSRIVALLIHNPSGYIMNAAEADFISTVDGIRAESVKAPIAYGMKGALNLRATGRAAEVYTIDGRRVASGLTSGSIQLPAGVYIVSNGNECAKVVVR